MKSKSNAVQKKMQTRVAEDVYEEPKAPGVGPVVIDGFLHFSPLDLTRYELAQAKVLNALQAIGLQKAKVEETKRNFEDHIRRLNEEMQGIVQLSAKCECDLRALQAELQELYKLDFSQITYDDVSGKISFLGSPVSEDDFLSK